MMNKQEFTHRVLRMENRLYRISCGLLKNPQDRMDAVQEAIVKAWANVHALRRAEYFESWWQIVNWPQVSRLYETIRSHSG